MAELAGRDPSLQERQPYRAAFEGVGVEEFSSQIMAWLATASHPVLHRPYLDCGFTPMVVGRRPLVTCGNANGDVPMMRFARQGDRDALRLLVRHDDAEREFAYTAGAEDALERAKTHGWTIVSMKDTWAAVFTAT